MIVALLTFLYILVGAGNIDCDFGYGMCNWIQDLTDNFDWTRSNCGTPTVGTGPYEDHMSGREFHSTSYNVTFIDC